MNKFLNILRTIFLPILFVSLTLVSCEGPAGAKGDIGLTGPKGDTGVSGAEQCGTCHNNGLSLYQKTIEWDESHHGNGDIYVYGNRNGCVECHTSQGFEEYAKTGVIPTDAPYADVASINCRTCHNIHVKYDATDWGFTKSDAVKFYEPAVKVATFDFKKGNVCAQCHQARATTPVIDPNAATYDITSSRFGGHHSPVANIFANNLAWAPTGPATIPPANKHAAAPEGCPTCHMTEPPVLHGAVLAGHTFKMQSDDHTLHNFAACTPCHSEVTTGYDQKANKFYSTFAADMQKADSLFQVKKWRSASGSWIGPDGKGATATNKLTVTPNQAAAIYAYQCILEDKSNGIHNPGYARAILDNILDVLSK